MMVDQVVRKMWLLKLQLSLKIVISRNLLKIGVEMNSSALVSSLEGGL